VEGVWHGKVCAAAVRCVLNSTTGGAVQAYGLESCMSKLWFSTSGEFPLLAGLNKKLTFCHLVCTIYRAFLSCCSNTLALGASSVHLDKKRGRRVQCSFQVTHEGSKTQSSWTAGRQGSLSKAPGFVRGRTWANAARQRRKTIPQCTQSSIKSLAVYWEYVGTGTTCCTYTKQYYRAYVSPH
jgi:hypothetical protein